MTGNRTAVRARVTGRVQGVSYRVWARDRAERLGLTGWVRNEADGSVTTLLVGPAEQVGQMLEAMRHGPAGARVSNVISEPADADPHPAGFRIRG